MFLRIDKLQIEMPHPKEADPNAAASVQELLGGRFGEMSTLMNYMYQSFNFRGRPVLSRYKSKSDNWLRTSSSLGLYSGAVSTCWSGTFSNGQTLSICNRV